MPTVKKEHVAFGLSIPLLVGSSFTLLYYAYNIFETVDDIVLTFHMLIPCEKNRRPILSFQFSPFLQLCPLKEIRYNSCQQATPRKA